MNWKIIGSSLSALVLFAALCVLSFFVGETKLSIALNLAVLVFGASLGWIVGIVVSPYSKKEQQQFTDLSKAVAVFASGYLVGKLDKLIEKLFDSALALESVHGFRLLAFVSAFALAVVDPMDEGRDDDDQ